MKLISVSLEKNLSKPVKSNTVVRFFHIRPLIRRRGRYETALTGGATVCVTGDTKKVDEVIVQTVFCSKKDPYTKKTGREIAITQSEKVVKLRYLGAELDQIAEEVYQKCGGYKQDTDYNFAMRYFLPK